ncbi:Radical SAM protein [Candidatus Desulfarcum epimagneticum]|uniref:Radical SAM protein n=1 Tax=uncultured Desulfobacteraceae bacterium TaxID=218296 RepID=A0A484HLB5_9BACT|nr:Radical SAM protein [uncultured Desulfobacteraceae bacterium]
MKRPSQYIKALETGLLEKQAARALEMMANCRLCPRKCGVDRMAGETGFCGAGNRARVSDFGPHFGEESPISGTRGSGTIFFAHCGLGCDFCQNFDISHQGRGRDVSDDELAGMMLSLQESGCHNINFVTPSHWVPHILSALLPAVEGGLEIPLVYNTSAYDRVKTLRLLDGIVDIYMPDFKFWDEKIAEDTCGAPDYPEAARRAISEMGRQAGDLALDGEGIAVSGLLIRHLVLPGGLAGTGKVMAFIAREISANAYVNVMPQYRPMRERSGDGKKTARDMERPISEKEYETALKEARAEGPLRLDPPRRVWMIQGFE